jgi:hypothetical protein
VISVQVSYIIGYLEDFVKARSISSLASLYIWRFSTIMSRIKKMSTKYKYQSTSIKVQVSISHTPEGTNLQCCSLAVGLPQTIWESKAHCASAISIGLCTTPVFSAAEAG